MKRLGLVPAAAAVGALVALVYFYFEAAVHHSIDLIWSDWLDTGSQRWLVVPVCLVVSLVFFGLQYYLDPGSERRESHGLGDMPKPTPINFAKVLFIGFWSLVAGATLGPEAILVPACMIAGAYLGGVLFRQEAQAVKLLGAAGFIALMAAFFHSFIAGILGLLLVKKQAKARPGPFLLVVGIAAAWAAVYVLGLLASPSFVRLPRAAGHFNIQHGLVLAGLLAAGYGLTYGLSAAHGWAAWFRGKLAKRQWWWRGLAASAGLAALYLLGGPLVEFTGNESIVPMLRQASELGVAGLVWLALVKIAAIGWSKAMGYRGGLVFPTVFIAATLVAIAQLGIHELNFSYGLIAVMAGVLAAERRVNILF